MSKATTSKLPTKWDLTKLFASDDDPRIEENKQLVEAESYKFINKWKDRSDYLEDVAVLKEALDEYATWKEYYSLEGDAGYYYALRESQEQANMEIKAKVNQLTDFANKIKNDIQFFELRLGKASADKQLEFLAASELEPYRHFLEVLFAQSKHQLSEPEEKIVNLYSPMATSNWRKMVSALLDKSTREVLDEVGNTAEKTFEDIMSLLSSPKQEVRDSAAKGLNSILAQYVDIAENELNSILQAQKVNDELRGFERPDKERHLGDDVDTEVVDALIAAVSGRFDIASRYYKLKAKLLGKEQLQYHERNVEIGNADRDISYEEAVDTVGRSLQKLDLEFFEIFNKFVDGGHVDVYPVKGKRGGAFCIYDLIHQPVYILLNFTSKTRDVMTLAHEVGHGINDMYMFRTQNSLNAQSSLATAEVASTFMEDFAMSELSAGLDSDAKLALNMAKLNDDISTIFRQIACYKFEQELHAEFRKQGYLGKEQIGKLFMKHMAAYMGDAVEQSAGSENWWVYWWHIRISFYVYSYASGLLISKSLQSAVRADSSFIEKVKQFLSAGSSSSPKQIFADLGIDITDQNFWNKGLSEVEELLAETEKLAG